MTIEELAKLPVVQHLSERLMITPGELVLIIEIAGTREAFCANLPNSSSVRHHVRDEDLRDGYYDEELSELRLLLDLPEWPRS